MVRFITKEIIDRIPMVLNVYLGITFKEDVPDLRNSKSIELM